MRLTGLTILIAEDDPLIASDLSFVLEDEGADVMGPYRTIADTLGELGKRRPAGAILDIRLLDGDSFPIAAHLAASTVPFVFYSAIQGRAARIAKATKAPVLGKAHESRDAVDVLTSLLQC